MLTRSIFALIALALVLAAVIAKAPATLIDQRVAALTDGRLRIANARGTIWNGSGELTLLPTGVRRPLAWRLETWPLVRGELRGTMTEQTSADRPATFAAGHGNFEVNRLELALPAEALLRATSAPPALASAGGTIDLRVDQLARRDDVLKAKLAIDWRDASFSGPRPEWNLALGDVRLEFAGEGRELPGSLTNSGGDVEIVGTLGLSGDKPPRLDATIKPRPGIDPDRASAIADALAIIGRPDGQGGYRVSWAGR